MATKGQVEEYEAQVTKVAMARASLLREEAKLEALRRTVFGPLSDNEAPLVMLDPRDREGWTIVQPSSGLVEEGPVEEERLTAWERLMDVRRPTKAMREVMALIPKNGGMITPDQLAKLLNIESGAAFARLARGVKAGFFVKHEDSTYRLADPTNEVK